MSWSQQVMNGLETVFRTFDFAKHISDEVLRAAEGRGLSSFEYATTFKGEVAAIPRWWLLGITRGDDEVVKNGRGKVADWMAANGGVEPEVPMGVVYLCFWHNRASDLSPLLPPQVLTGAGTITFREWGQAHAFTGGHLWELGVALNDRRRDGDLGGLGTQPTKHLRLSEDFAWRPIVSLESLDDGQKIRDLANNTAEFIAEKVGQ